MPEHVHLLVVPMKPTSQISTLLADIKRPFSWKLKRQLDEERHPLLEELTIRQRPGVLTFRFWQEGGGYDRHLTEPGTIVATMNYIHQNPVRRGLCRRATEWQWSSAPRLLADDISSLRESPTLLRFEPETGRYEF